MAFTTPGQGSTPGYSFAAEVEANRATAAAQTAALASTVTNPYLYNYSNSSTGTGSTATAAAAPSRITYPSETLQYMTGEATNYPTYMRNYGEQLAQKAYQKQMNQGLRAGAASQGYLAAMDALNTARLGYMGTAGQQAYEIAKAQEEAMTKLYGLDINQRGQDIDYQTRMAAIVAQQNASGGRGSSMTIGGGGGLRSSSSSSTNPYYGGYFYTDDGKAGIGRAGSYTALGSSTNWNAAPTTNYGATAPSYSEWDNYDYVNNEYVY